MHHRLSALAARYSALFPEPEFRMDIPFRTEYLGFSEAEMEALKKHEPLPSIFFRYPVEKPGIEWRGIHGFKPADFLCTLNTLHDDFTRIGAALGNI